MADHLSTGIEWRVRVSALGRIHLYQETLPLNRLERAFLRPALALWTEMEAFRVTPQWGLGVEVGEAIDE
jgi:hypothetical protein